MQEQFQFSAYQSVSRARRAVFALLMAVILIAGGMQHLTVHAQVAGLPDFTTIVEKSEPAVVNIRTTEKARASRGNGAPEMDEDMLEFFRRFGVPIPNQPQNPRRAPQQPPQQQAPQAEEVAAEWVDFVPEKFAHHHD
mgnify:CR=1 FL=1